jgi:hypothetical protein
MSVFKIKKTENFVVLHKGALEDPRLSFKAKGFWAYCMSRPPDWTFNVKHLETVSRDGHDSIYSAIKELIEFGYVKKVQEHVNGRFQNVDYEVYEIQIILPLREKQEAVFQDAENPVLLRNEEELRIEKEIKPRPSASPPSQAQEISLLLLEAIKKTKPDFKSPKDLKKWSSEIDLMLRRDHRDPDRVKKVINWLPSSSFWKTNILSAASFREKFDRLELQMNDDASKNASVAPRIDSWELEAEHRAWMRAKAPEIKELISKGLIRTVGDYVEIILPSSVERIYYKSPTFINEIECHIRKLLAPPKLNC